MTLAEFQSITGISNLQVLRKFDGEGRPRFWVAIGKQGTTVYKLPVDTIDLADVAHNGTPNYESFDLIIVNPT